MCEKLVDVVSKTLNEYFERQNRVKALDHMADSARVLSGLIEEAQKVYYHKVNVDVDDNIVFKNLREHYRHVIYDISVFEKSCGEDSRDTFFSVVTFLRRLIDDLPAILSEAGGNIKIEPKDIKATKRFLQGLSSLMFSQSGNVRSVVIWHAVVSDVKSCFKFMFELVENANLADTWNVLWACNKLWGVFFKYLHDAKVFLGQVDKDAFGDAEVIQIGVHDLVGFWNFMELLSERIKSVNSSDWMDEIYGAQRHVRV